MTVKIANTGARMTVDVTSAEREAAKVLKKEFKSILRDLDDAVEVLSDLRDAIVEQHPSKEDLKNVYRGRLLRYRTKIIKVFNKFLLHTKSGMEMMNKISDPNMIRLREILIAEMGELNDGVESLLDLLGETKRDGFTKSLEGLVAQIEKRQGSIEDVIDNQLFNHIEQNILGRMKISDIKFRIRKRSRLIRQLME